MLNNEIVHEKMNDKNDYSNYNNSKFGKKNENQSKKDNFQDRQNEEEDDKKVKVDAEEFLNLENETDNYKFQNLNFIVKKNK